MPRDSVEACLNVWCIVDEGTGLVYRIAARAYALGCPDREKADVLKELALTDFHLARELPCYRSTGRRLLTRQVASRVRMVYFQRMFTLSFRTSSTWSAKSSSVTFQSGRSPTL